MPFSVYITSVGIFSENIINNSSTNYTQWIILLDTISNISTLGQVIYTYYLAYFLIAGIVLLIALIGAVTLTHEYKHNIHDVSTFKQISRLKQNAVFNLNR